MAQADGAGGGGDEENPFSFKSFIKRASTSGPGAESEGKGGRKDREKAKGKKASSTSSPASEGALPFPEEGSRACRRGRYGDVWEREVSRHTCSGTHCLKCIMPL